MAPSISNHIANANTRNPLRRNSFQLHNLPYINPAHNAITMPSERPKATLASLVTAPGAVQCTSIRTIPSLD